MNPKKVGRKSEFLNKILNLDDHPEIADLYIQIEKLRSHQGWGVCHVYEGASKKGVPVLKHKDRTVRLADFFSTHLHLPKGKKRCDTPNCFNPYHYQFEPDMGRFEKVEVLHTDSGVDELIEYVIDAKAVPRFMWTFETLRPYFDVQEVTDAQLNRYLENLPNENNT